MQNPSSSVPQAEAILQWLQQEMGCTLSQAQKAGAGDRGLPSPDVLRKICRGNMIPVWNFFLDRVKSEKTVERVRRNIHVHGTLGHMSQARQAVADDKTPVRRKVQDGKAGERLLGRSGSSKWLDGKGRGRGREASKEVKADRSDVGDTREVALRERELAERELGKQRQLLERLMKDAKARMLDLTREETDRQRILDDKFSSRHKQILLEGYDMRCEEVVHILGEYLRRLNPFVEHAHEIQRGNAGLADPAADSVRALLEQEGGYGAAAVKSVRQSDDHIFLETVHERAIRRACEAIAANMLERIRTTVTAYEGEGSQGDPQPDLSVAGFEKELGPALELSREASMSLLKSPQTLLKALSQYTARVVNLVDCEAEKLDVGADADQFRDGRTLDDTSGGTEESMFAVQSRLKSSSKNGLDSTSRSTSRQLRERQKAHVRQFIATEEVLNRLAAAKADMDLVVKELNTAIMDGNASQLSNGKDPHHTSVDSRQSEIELLAKEREVAGVKASVSTLLSEVQRLRKKCEERTEAEEILRQKWKKIEEFDARRLELEAVYSFFIRANMAAWASWEHHPKSAREQASSTILPICMTLQRKLSGTRDLIEAEVGHFKRVPESRVCALPVHEQALSDYMRGTVIGGIEAAEAGQKSAALLAARVGAGDPSAIPSICRISAALRTFAGSEVSDAGLATVVESVRVFLQAGAQSANLLEDLARSVFRVQMLQDIASNGRAVLASAISTRPEYERTSAACIATARKQDKTTAEWLAELKTAVQDALSSLNDCKQVRGLVDEWWEQPASTAVDWVTVDGQNIVSWLAHVKQLQTAFYEKQLS